MLNAFDEQALMERVDGDVEFLDETIAMLDEDSPALLDEIHAAARSGDAAAGVLFANVLGTMSAVAVVATAILWWQAKPLWRWCPTR